MANLAISGKRLLINQANTMVVLVTGVAAFVLIFCAVATKTLMSQSSYQNRVISQKKIALNQLNSDKNAVVQLKKSYTAFTSTAQNVLGGDPNGSGALDGNNAQLVLDALPSAYDYPALATSLEKLIASPNPSDSSVIKIDNITGVDDQIAQSGNATSSNPQPVDMPFDFTVEGNYGSIQNLIASLERSIRPIQDLTMSVTAGQKGDLTLDLNAKTFYQPAKSLNITSTVVQ